ncbi:hypothetical protein ACSBR2_033292 [Camellia fascicularis]
MRPILEKAMLGQTLELEGSGLATRKVSWLFYPYVGKVENNLLLEVVHDASWSGPIKEEQYIKIGKAIAVLAHGAMCYVMFCSFKELIKDKDYNTVGESVFKSIVKFVLSVFDMINSKFCLNVPVANFLWILFLVVVSQSFHQFSVV